MHLPNNKLLVSYAFYVYYQQGNLYVFTQVLSISNIN